MAKTGNRRRATAGRKTAPVKRPPWRPSGAEVLLGLVVLALGGFLVYLAASGSDEPPDKVDGGTAGVTGPDVHSLVADPTTPGRLFVGGHQAVSASEDGGTTWTRVGSLDDADAMGWAFHDGAVFVSGHPGLNRSDDGASSFERINEGLPGTDVHAFGAGQNVLYGSAVDGGFFASTDDGATWEVRATDGTQPFFGRIVVDPGDDEHLFVADAQRGVVESTDGGRSWAVLDVGPRHVVDAGDGWLAAEGGVAAVMVVEVEPGVESSTSFGF